MCVCACVRDRKWMRQWKNTQREREETGWQFLNSDSVRQGRENSLGEGGVWSVAVGWSDELKRDKNDSSLCAQYIHAHTHADTVCPLRVERSNWLVHECPTHLLSANHALHVCVSVCVFHNHRMYVCVRENEFSAQIVFLFYFRTWRVDTHLRSTRTPALHFVTTVARCCMASYTRAWNVPVSFTPLYETHKSTCFEPLLAIMLRWISLHICTLLKLTSGEDFQLLLSLIFFSFLFFWLR